MIIIRNYKESDTKALWDIHFNTIRNVNIRDYSQVQVEVWAPDVFDNVIVGYTDLQSNGLIDHFFCHHEY